MQDCSWNAFDDFTSRSIDYKIVEFGPLLAFTACLMNFEKLAHGSPQWTQGAQTHTSFLVLIVSRTFFEYCCTTPPAVLAEIRYKLKRLQSSGQSSGRIHFVTFEDMLVLISTTFPRNILHTSNRFLIFYCIAIILVGN